MIRRPTAHAPLILYFITSAHVIPAFSTEPVIRRPCAPAPALFRFTYRLSTMCNRSTLLSGAWRLLALSPLAHGHSGRAAAVRKAAKFTKKALTLDNCAVPDVKAVNYRWETYLYSLPCSGSGSTLVTAYTAFLPPGATYTSCRMRVRSVAGSLALLACASSEASTSRLPYTKSTLFR